MSFLNAFKDSRGDWNLAELIAAPSALAGVGTSLWSTFHGHQPFDIQSYGLGLGGLVAALGAAQRLRGDAEIDRDHERGEK